jgi:hypothetical protein
MEVQLRKAGSSAVTAVGLVGWRDLAEGAKAKLDPMYCPLLDGPGVDVVLGRLTPDERVVLEEALEQSARMQRGVLTADAAGPDGMPRAGIASRSSLLAALAKVRAYRDAAPDDRSDNAKSSSAPAFAPVELLAATENLA